MTKAENSKKHDFDYFVKFVAPTVFSIVVAVISIIFWFQNYGADNYYDITSGKSLEKQVVEVKADMKSIRQQNLSIIATLGRIEGRLEAQN